MFIVLAHHNVGARGAPEKVMMMVEANLPKKSLPQLSNCVSSLSYDMPSNIAEIMTSYIFLIAKEYNIQI